MPHTKIITVTEKQRKRKKTGRAEGQKKKDGQTDRQTDRQADVLPGCDCLLYAAAGAADTCCDVLSR